MQNASKVDFDNRRLRHFVGLRQRDGRKSPGRDKRKGGGGEVIIVGHQALGSDVYDAYHGARSTRNYHVAMLFRFAGLHYNLARVEAMLPRQRRIFFLKIY